MVVMEVVVALMIDAVVVVLVIDEVPFTRIPTLLALVIHCSH